MYAGGLSYFYECSFGFRCHVSAEAMAIESKNRQIKKDAFLTEFELNKGIFNASKFWE
jgi:hypothetical protein